MVELSEFGRVDLLAMLDSTTVWLGSRRERGLCCGARRWLKRDVAARASVSRPTVDAVLERFATDGVAGLLASR
jgi:hypothetical protein